MVKGTLKCGFAPFFVRVISRLIASYQHTYKTNLSIMKRASVHRPLLSISLICLLSFYSAEAQSTVTRQVFDFYELKGFLLKHRATVERMLSMKRYKSAGSKERPESTIYIFKKEGDTTQLLFRVRKKDDLVSEVAWDETIAVLGNLTHDAVNDGFVPVNGNSQYYNRFQKMGLLVNYALAEEKTIPCVIRAVEGSDADF